MSLPQSESQIRLDILQLLYNKASDNPSNFGVDRAIIQATLQITQQQLDDSMTFLEANGLVALSRIGGKWTFAKITGEGLNVIENKQQYAEKYAFAQASTSQLQEQTGNVPRIQAKQNFADLVSSSFKLASDQVLDANIPNNDKGRIERQLRELQKQLLKAEKADLGSIKKEWDWLKKNAAFVCPILAPTVLQSIKLIILGSQ